MAEGGEQADDGNPFSFKKFVSKKGQPDTSPPDDLDIFDLSSDTSQRKRDKSKKQILVVEGMSYVFAMFES